MKPQLIVLGLITCCFLQAQRGPAGIDAADGTSDLVLWLDASQLTGYYIDQTIKSWTDFSGYGNNASQSTYAQQPTYKSGLLNGKAVISFLQSNDTELSGSIANESGEFNAPATIISLVKFDKASQTNSSDNDYVISLGSDGPVHLNSGGEMTVIARRRNEASNQDKYYTYDGIDVDISDAAVLDDNTNWFIIVQIMRDTDSPYHTAYVDGSEVAFTSSTYIGPLATNGDFTVANWTRSADFPGTDYYLDGDIAEMMVFGRELNLTELDLIHDYLIAKWNGAAATDIDISSGDTFADNYAGDLAANGHYDSDVIGVGQTSSSDKLTLASNAGLELSIATNFGDGDFLVAGHNITDNDLSTDGLTGNQQRWERVWYVDVTDGGSTATTTFTFDISESGLGGSFSGNATNYDIIYKETEGGSWSFLSASSTYTDDQIEFSGIDISANGSANGDGYYTLATTDMTTSILGVKQLELADKGPGGIEDTDGTTTLEMWLDVTEIIANDGDYVNGWTDKSGSGAHASQANSNWLPSYDTDDSPNGMPTLLFDGTTDYLEGNLDSNPAAPLTLVAVANFASLDQPDGEFDNDYVIGIGSTGNSNTEHLSISRRKDENGAGLNMNKYYSWTGLGASYGPEIAGQTWTFISATHNTSTQRHEVYFDGVLQASPSPDYTAGSISATASDFNVGRWFGGNNFLNGEIAEIILFSEVLNAAKLNILHSYLAAKYEIDFEIADGDRYIGDCSAIVAMTDCSVDHDYDLDVAGIGTEGSGGSSVSHSSASSAGLNVAMTASETTDGGANDTFDDGDYFMFGHNREAGGSLGSDINTSSSAIERRIWRDWFVDITENDATPMKVDLTFDFSELGLDVFPDGSASNYKLLFRTTNVFDSDWDILASASSIDGDQVTFTDIDGITEDGFISLGTLSEANSPLPVKLLEFSAEARPDHVALSWSTASESDNEGFSIQRSAYGLDFEEIEFREGAASSEEVQFYSQKDEQPAEGFNYYRLKQIDMNGNSTWSEVVRVYYESSGEPMLKVMPNPASEVLSVKFRQMEDGGIITLRDLNGKIVDSHEVSAHGQTTFDVSRLRQGIYLVQAQWPENVASAKVLIRR